MKNTFAVMAALKPTIIVVLFLLFASMKAFCQISWDGDAGDGLWTSAANWSGNTVPGDNDDVEIIGDYDVTISANDSCKSLTLQSRNGGNRNALLIVDGGRLGIRENMNMEDRNGNGNACDLIVRNGGHLLVGGNLYVTKDQSASNNNDMTVTAENNNSVLEVLADIIVIADGNNSSDIGFKLADDAQIKCVNLTLTQTGDRDNNFEFFQINKSGSNGDHALFEISGNVTITNNSGSQEFDIALNYSGELNVGGNFTYNATAGEAFELEIDRDAQMNVTGDFNLNKASTGNLMIHLNESNDGAVADAQLIVGGNMNIDYSNGNDLDIQLNNNSNFSIGGDFDVHFGSQNNASNDQLTIVLNDASELSVAGTANLQYDFASGTSTGEITLNNSSKFNVGNPVGAFTDQLIVDMESSSGADFDITLNATSVLNVYGEMLLDKDAGNNMNLALNSNSMVNIFGDLDLDNDQGSGLISVQLNNTSALEIRGDMDLSGASNSNQLIIEQYDDTKIFLGGSTVQTSNRGTWDCQANTVIEFNGLDVQTIHGESGNGVDYFNFQNIIINNSGTGDSAVVFDGIINVEGGITFVDGVVKTTSSGLLVIADGAFTAGASDDSYVSGYVRKVGNTPSSEFFGSGYAFPIGESGYYRPIYIGAPLYNTDAFDARYHYASPHSAGYDTSAVSGTITNVSNTEYWDLEQSAGISSVYVTLPYEADLSFSGLLTGIDLISDLRVAHWNSSTNTWEDFGNGATTGNAFVGSVRSLTQVSNFSPFTNGNSSSGFSLPVELLFFDAQANSITEEIDLYWSTASELNNDYFEIERSIDGTFWELVTRVDGAGNSSRQIDYQVHDFDPYVGTSYYRLKQMDIDGSRSYSSVVAVIIVFGDEAIVDIFPNPTKGLVHLRGDLEVLKNFKVHNMAGMDQSNQIDVIQNTSSLIIIDISKLPIGMYTIQGEEYSQKLIKN